MKKIILDLFKRYWHLALLAAIIGLGVFLRWSTANADILLDYDPWWFYRHAENILENNFQPPRWDTQSFYPPGRPIDFALGWPYTIAIFYSLFGNLLGLSLMKFSAYFVAWFSAAAAIPAYFAGKYVTNKWGGLMTAFVAVATPTFISVSMAGYPDSDAVDVFYSFIVLLTTLYAIKKADIVKFENVKEFGKSFAKYLPYVLPAIVSNFVFALNWNASWYMYFIFFLFAPIYIIFKIIELFIEGVQTKTKITLPKILEKVRESKNIFLAIIVIGLLGELLSILTMGWPYNTIPPHDQFVQGSNLLISRITEPAMRSASYIVMALLYGLYGALAGYSFSRFKGVVAGGVAGLAVGLSIIIFGGLTGQSLIVNISVAELQPLNVFTSDGFSQVLGRIGGFPMLLALVGLPLVTAYKLIFRKKIDTAEYFVIIWMIISFWLITRGVRFSLLFSLSVATAAGFVVGNMLNNIRSFRKDENNSWPSSISATVIAFIIIGVVWQISDTSLFAQFTGGLEVNGNWRGMMDWIKANADKDAIIATWWDPGHILAGYTGMKIMADGAHCGPASCAVYDHNTRIQDMGRAFAVSDEDESMKILSKYMSLTKEQCDKVKLMFGGSVPSDACNSPSEMYVIASADLIGKYYWLTYFGTGSGRNYAQFPLKSVDGQGNLNYGDTITIMQTNNQIIPVINVPNQGIRNGIIKNLVYFQDGQWRMLDYGETQGNVINGMLWLDQSYQTAIFMDPTVKDSVFTRMYFFNGEGLKNFKLVYQNPEIKLFKVSFENLS